MKQLLVGAIAGLAALGGFAGSSANADDRELQAILVKQGCVAGSIRQTELSPLARAYDVTCRGSGRSLTIMCIETVCRLQPRPRHDEEGGMATGYVRG